MIKAPELIPIQLTGDLRRGGWRLSGQILSDTDAVAYGKNWQLRGKSGAGFFDPVAREIFSGHIIAEPDQLQVSRFRSEAKIVAGTMQELLMGESLQDIGFTEQSSPANDHQITTMNLGKIFEHIAKHHCNAIYHATDMPDGAITVTDFDTTNSIPLERYNVSKSSNLWRSLQAIGGGEEAGEFYRPYFDRFNKFYYQPAPPFWSSPPAAIGTITKDHLKGVIRVRRNNNMPGQRIGQVSITALKDFQTPLTATYPDPPADGKILPPKDGIWANSQAKADTQAERLYKWLTRTYTLQLEIDPGMLLLGDDGKGIDLANKVTLTYVGATEDASTGAGLHLDLSDDYFVYGASVRFDPFGKAAQAFLILEQDPT